MAQRILAIDISANAVRVAAIESSFRDYKVTGLYEDEGGAGLSLAEHLRTFLAKHGLHPDTVLVTLPGELATQRMLSLPFRDRKKLSQTVPFELESQVPFGLDDVVVDYQVLTRQKTGSTVLAALVQKSDLERHLSALSEAGLDPKIVDFGPLCGLNLLNALAKELPENFAYVEVTRHDATAALYRQRQLQGVRALLPPPSSNGSGPGHVSAEALAHELRWTLMVLNGGAIEGNLPCLLAGEPSDFLTDTARAFSESAGLRVVRLESLPLRSLPGVSEGVAPAFARPLGLALRELEPATTLGLNFRRGEFTYKKGQAEIRAQLLRIGALGAVLAFLIVTNLFVSYGLQRARANAFDERIRSIVASVLPATAVTAGNAVDVLQAEVNAVKTKLGLLADTAPVGNLTAIDLLYAISGAVPKNVTVDVDEYVMDPDSIRVRGRTQSYENVDTLKKTFEEMPYFREVQAKDIKSAPDGKGVDFRLILTLNKPGQESKRP
jgi:general secretion pathway protein L